MPTYYFGGDVDEINVQRMDSVVRIELNRPTRLNALTAPMVQLLVSAVNAAGAEYGSTRVLVIAGALPGFCAGADRSALEFLTASSTTDEQRLAELRATNELILGIRAFPGPTIAEVGGAAVGGGCNLALACDLVYASEAAHFGEVFVRHGLALDMGGSWLLPRLVGPRKASELALRGRVLDARQALDLGLINEVVAPAQLRATVAEVSAELVGRPAGALSAIKSQLRRGPDDLDLAAALELEALTQNELLRGLSERK